MFLRADRAELSSHTAFGPGNPISHRLINFGADYADRADCAELYQFSLTIHADDTEFGDQSGIRADYADYAESANQSGIRANYAEFHLPMRFASIRADYAGLHANLSQPGTP